MGKNGTGMRILKLEAENVKRISAVAITPDGSLVVIGGKNGAGKTSVLDSIAIALGGKNLCPAKPIKDGAERGVVKVDLGELVVERTFTQKESYLTLKTGEGYRVDSPQAILDGLVGKLSFDPLAFANMKPADQAETLKALVGLDLSKLDEERSQVYEARTAANKSVRETQARLDGMPAHEGVPGEVVSVSDLMTELKAREESNDANADQRESLDLMRQAVSRDHEERTALLEQIESLQSRAHSFGVLIEEAESKIQGTAEIVDDLQDANVDEIRTQIAAADEVNAKVRANAARAETAQGLETVQREATKLDDRIKKIDQKKAEQLASAEFPIEGLAFDEDGVIFNRIPFDQISQAEKLRVSVAMGLSMNPKLRVMLIRDGSLLDEENLALIAQMAEENDAQIWIERVGNGAEISVLIEDGTVVQPASEPVEVS